MDLVFRSNYDSALEWARLSDVKSLITREAKAYIENKEIGFMNRMSHVSYLSRVTFGKAEFNVYSMAQPRAPFVEMVVFDDNDYGSTSAISELQKMFEATRVTEDGPGYKKANTYKFNMGGKITALPDLSIYGRGGFVSYIERGHCGPFKAIKLITCFDILTITTAERVAEAAATWEKNRNGK